MGVLDGFKQGLSDVVGSNQKAVLEIADFSGRKFENGGGGKIIRCTAADSGFDIKAMKDIAGAGSISDAEFEEYKDFQLYRFECQFNPNQLSITGYGGEELPIQNYASEIGNSDIGSKMYAANTHIDLSFRLIFDKTNIQDAFYSDKFTLNLTSFGKKFITGEDYSVQPEVEALTTIVRDRKGLAKFTWGDMSYQGVINSITAEYTMFNVNCEPIRAFVDINMVIYDEKVSSNLSELWKNEYMRDVYNIQNTVAPAKMPDKSKRDITTTSINASNPKIDLEKLETKYEGYHDCIVKVFVDDKDITEDEKLSIRIRDVSVKITSDYKAGMAEYSIYSVFNEDGSFITEDFKKYISMGTCITIYMGHARECTEVFKGFIAEANFVYSARHDSESYIRITALDIKGVMMSNRSSKRLKANFYSDAVKEIFDQPVYQGIKSNNGITDITVSETPDKQSGNDQGDDEENRIEMVVESDYEFLVRAAKRFNFEFFTLGGKVIFRKAKSEKEDIGELKPHSSILSFDVDYNITDVVGEVIVRTLDIGKASKVEVKKGNANKVSLGSKAKPLIKNKNYIYIDSAIESKNEAENRAEYLLDDTSYKLGSLKMTFKGIPEFIPGRFLTLKGFGAGVSNRFYITDVMHDLTDFYTTTIYGKAATL